MKEFDFTPSVPGFSGHIKVKVPSYKERMGIAKELGVKLNSDGSVNLGEAFDLFEKLSQKVDQFVVGVDLKYGEQEFKSIEDLSYYAEGADVLSELGNVMMKGVSLGKN